jgi:hypothetical protein
MATGQTPDKLIFKGDTLSIEGYPLEGLPQFDSLQKVFFANQQVCLMTSCWRKYQAEWTLVDNKLYLTNIFSCCYFQDSIKADLKTLFKDKFVNGRVKADWVNANLIAPHGKYLFYVIENYYPVHEEQIELTFKNGQLVETSVYDNSRSKKSVYSQDENLSRYIYSTIQWESLPESDKSVRVFVRFSANEYGVIDQVEVIKGFHEAYDREALRVVKSLPEWDIVFRLGKHQRHVWNLPIVFSKENRKKYLKK